MLSADYIYRLWTIFIFSADDIYVGNYLGLPCNKVRGQ